MLSRFINHLITNYRIQICFFLIFINFIPIVQIKLFTIKFTLILILFKYICYLILSNLSLTLKFKLSDFKFILLLFITSILILYFLTPLKKFLFLIAIKFFHIAIEPQLNFIQNIFILKTQSNFYKTKLPLINLILNHLKLSFIFI